MASQFGQNIYNSYSQIANPFTDPSKDENAGAPNPLSGLTSPYAPQNGGGGVTGQTYGTPQSTPTSPVNAATTAALNTPTPSVYKDYGVVDPLQTAAAVARRGGGNGQIGSMIGGTAGSVLGGAGAGALLGGKLGMWGGPVAAGIGTAVGALGGLIGGAVNRKAATAPTDFAYNDASRVIGDAYKSYLGREASPQEINTHLQNIGWNPGNSWVGENGLAYIVNAIQNSEEATRKAQNLAGASATTPTGNPSWASQYNLNDPATAAVVQAFAAKGLTPRAEDIPYWTRRIAETGGWDNAENQSYWLDRMAMKYGGAGDYSESGKVGNEGNYRIEPGYGGGSQGGTYGTSLGANNPAMQALLGAVGASDTQQGAIPFVDFRTVGSIDTDTLLKQIMAQLQTGR